MLRMQKIDVVIFLNFPITFPMIWRCACDFFKVLQKFEMAAMHELHIFLRAQDLKIEVRKFYNMQMILLKFKMVDFF